MRYDYECPSCGEVFKDIEQPISDPHIYECTHCGTECNRIWNTIMWEWIYKERRP